MAEGKTVEELRAEAAERNIEGRSSMNKAELEAALSKAQAGDAPADQGTNQTVQPDQADDPQQGSIAGSDDQEIADAQAEGGTGVQTTPTDRGVLRPEDMTNQGAREADVDPDSRPDGPVATSPFEADDVQPVDASLAQSVFDAHGKDLSAPADRRARAVALSDGSVAIQFGTSTEGDAADGTAGFDVSDSVILSGDAATSFLEEAGQAAQAARGARATFITDRKARLEAETTAAT